MKLQLYKVVITEILICTVSIEKVNYRCKWSALQTWNLHHRVCHKPITGYVIPSALCITTNLKSMKKYRLHATTLTSRELTAITYNSFGALQPNKDF